ncbi:MAG: putative ABC exporter domain-containing protein [Oscillospiraceae bacterium]|jgi:hypothetical protein|nr:putative ABC exporter domain-containing protein [Oscillospiraceae bacterium]
MGVLTGLLLTKMKNQLRSFVRSPGKLIVTVLAAGLLIFVVWAGGMARSEAPAVRDRAELAAIIKVFYMMIFIMIAYSGLSKGATFFSMADVNMLFPAPVSPVRILVYGLTQQLGTSVVIGVFILYQYATMHGQYAVTIGGMLLILLGYSLTIFTANIAAMTIYAATSVGASRRKVARPVFMGVCGLFILPSLIRIASALVNHEPMAASLVSAAGIVSLGLFPFAGWLAWGASRLMAGEMSGLLGLLGAGAGVTGLILFLNHAQPDYYEDVLQVTETAALQKQNQRDGRMPEATRKNVKLRERDGALGGMGARAFAYKQRLEDNRGRALLFSPMSWTLMAAMVLVSLFMRGLDEAEAGVITVLALGLYMQMLFSMFDRWVRELLLPYIYLTPEPPFRKLLACLSQVFRQQAIESALTWAICGVILRMHIVTIILMIALRMTFSLLLISTHLLVDRLWSHIIVKWLQVTLYFVMLFVMIAPGIALGVALMVNGVVIFSEAGTMFVAILAAELPIGIGVLYACRNLLENAEMNQA